MSVMSSNWNQMYAGVMFAQQGGLYVPMTVPPLPSVYPSMLYGMSSCLEDFWRPEPEEFDDYDDYLIAVAEWESDDGY